jgi:DNA-binding MarR family transcriptional regulator
MTAKIQLPNDYYEQTPEGDAAATEAVMNLVRTADLLFDEIGRLLRPLNVSAAGGLVLGMLRDRGPMSPSELGERLIVTRATVTGLVDSLEKRGYVRRSAHPSDRRSQIVELTPAGLDVNAKLRTLIHGHEKEWLSVLTADEIRTLIGLTHRIQDSMGSGGPNSGRS